MSRMSRRRNNENQDSLLTPCFEIGENVELKDVPETGEEFLLKVITERKKCQVVPKCDKDLSKFAKNQSLFIEEPPVTPVPDAFKPTIEWQNIQVADFSEIRMYISRLQAKQDSWPYSVKKHKIVPKDISSWKNFFETNSPTVSCIFGLSQTLLEHGIELLVNSLNKIIPGQSISNTKGRWIYAFLACLREPLFPDTISTLRTLARKCAEIRSNINVEDEGAVEAVAPLNVFICLVAKYFRQHDLADN